MNSSSSLRRRGRSKSSPDLPTESKPHRRTDYLFQIAGPTSLKTLEKVTRENLRDIRFLRFRNSQIDGTPVEVAPIGMTGNLAYELHGPIEDGPKIYDAVYGAGQEFGIERLGWGTYLVNHVEGGFPQITWTFIPVPGMPDDAARAFIGQFFKISGSVDPANLRARFRTPVEVGWHRMCKFDHDFLGRAALEAEVAHPSRTIATLRWNPEDVIDIYASLFQPGEAYKPLDLPYAPNVWPQAHADHISNHGRQIGCFVGYDIQLLLPRSALDGVHGRRCVENWQRSHRPVGRLRRKDQKCPCNGGAIPIPDRRTEQRPRRGEFEMSDTAHAPTTRRTGAIVI